MSVDTRGLQAEIRKVAERAAAGAAREMAADLRASSPVDTGATKAKTDVRLVGRSPSTIRYRAQSTTPQALFTDAGTRPHVIRPKRAGGVLVFNVGGLKVFARQVNHPGSKKHKGWFTDRVTALRWAVLIGKNAS